MRNFIDYEEENCIGVEETEKQGNPDSFIRYIGDSTTNVMHDKLCIKVDEIPESDRITLNELDKTMKICHNCRRKIYIRNAIKDDDNFSWYLDFFDAANYGTSRLRGFIYMRGVELLKISDIELQIKYKEDTWIAVYVKRNRYKLFHNSYVFTSKYDRRIIPGKFHVQKKDPMRLTDLLRYIAMYDWEGHFC